MKIKSVDRIKLSGSEQQEIVLTNKRHRSIIIEGSILECDEAAREHVTHLFEALDCTGLSEIGMIVINNEDRYNTFLHKAKYNSDLDRLDNQTFKIVLNEQQNDSVRYALKKSLSELTRSRLGLIIDSIDNDYNMVVKKKMQLESMGYDCIVCFVNVPLQETLTRKNDTKIINDDQVMELWKGTQKNISRYSELFEGNIVVVDGSANNKFIRGIEFAVDNFVADPVKNKVAQNIMIRSRTVHNGE